MPDELFVLAACQIISGSAIAANLEERCFDEIRLFWGL
jgi:hypothetical protein